MVREAFGKNAYLLCGLGRVHLHIHVHLDWGLIFDLGRDLHLDRGLGSSCRFGQVVQGWIILVFAVQQYVGMLLFI
jgi:hypothetical protein